MPLHLIPREAKFFDLLEGLSSPLADRSAALAGRSAAPADPEAGAGPADAIGRMVAALDASFITPFDREDIYRLAVALVDVRSTIDDAAHRLGESEDTSGFAAALGAIVAICTGIDAAVRALRDPSKNAEGLRGHLVAIERDVDAAARRLPADGPEGREDLAAGLRRIGIEASVRRALDACREAGRAVAVVVVKGA